MIKLELVNYDKFEVVYKWKGLHVAGNRYDADSYMFRFPEIDANKAIERKIDISYVFKDYEIPRFQENLKPFFSKTAKEELEKELTKLMKMPMNQEILIMMVLDDVVFIDK
jgi:hypothetical protein